MYSTSLGTESDLLDYTRVRSALLRSKPQNTDVVEPKKTNEQISLLPIPNQFSSNSPSKIIQIQNPDDPLLFSMEQLQNMSKTKLIVSKTPNIIHSNATNPIFFHENPKPPSTNSSPNKKKSEIKLAQPVEQDFEYHSKILEGIDDIINEDDIDPDEEPGSSHSHIPISLLPADNPFLPPIENYVTADHVRMSIHLFELLNIPYVMAPEEACAECVRLEMENIVDAVGSDDNNSVLFGSKWLIRGLFTSPQSITLKSLDDIGLTRERLLNLAMMIDGDYNYDIRRRLFTVGPVRGIEILSQFPNKEKGLIEFKEWWLRIIKYKGQEEDDDKKKLAKKKWIRRLAMPTDFPPSNLMQAFKKPVVGTEKVATTKLTVKKDELIKYVSQNSMTSPNTIEEYVNAFIKRIGSFDGNAKLIGFSKNSLAIPEKFEVFLDKIKEYDKENKTVDSSNGQEFLDDDDSSTLSTEEESEKDSIEESQ
ncbi:DNA excision repair protein ERCC-5 [Histomonas meleagridis]|uniref:DNA excision repair protein ERCC-5 n=1 Tax=Histomonas meleagridis TaxID=135588 RepID=UPI00355AB49E|nr:DNA excision repair protein ERCC-5 [Histomonas meleagridis]KAH0801554.1 DNA excision repair protein ERCC-5 [Histomonas meleagridis]